MPRINIREINRTQATTTATVSDAVFVPGFVNKKYFSPTLTDGIAEAYVPYLCSTVEEFEGYFGREAPTFTGDQYYVEGSFAPAATGGLDSTSGRVIMYKDGTADPGYVYAKELITAGISVVYVRCNKSNDGSDITVAHMYDVLTETQDTAPSEETVNMWDIVGDTGDYPTIKFLTTGGYPSFEYGHSLESSVASASSTLAEKGNLTFDKDTFNTKAGTSSLADPTIYNFVYKQDSQSKKSNDDPTCSWYYRKETDETWTKVESISGWGFTIKEGVQLVAGTDFIDVYAVKPGYTLKNNIVKSMLDCAQNRGDCVALIDHTDNNTRKVKSTDTASVYYSVNNGDYKIVSNGNYGAMFTPWCSVATSVPSSPTYMPASFVYLKSYAVSSAKNSTWLAIAGTDRGAADILGAHTDPLKRISNTIADSYQSDTGISINPIANIRPWNYLIWGNRTLNNNTSGLTADSFLNTRNMISDIKKVAYNAAKTCMFEQNSDILWINFRNKITPTLNKMQSGNGIASYSISKIATSQKAKLACSITINPIYAVESFDIDIYIEDDQVTVTE